jgi:excisionase family DNA binding protein
MTDNKRKHITDLLSRLSDALEEADVIERPREPLAADLLTLGEAREILNVSRASIDNFMNAAGLPFVMVGSRRRIVRGALNEWVKAREGQITA